jgi:hypothetical protein
MINGEALMSAKWFKVQALKSSTPRSSEAKYLSSPKRTRQDEASSDLQYLQPLTTLQGILTLSANTCRTSVTSVKIQVCKKPKNNLNCNKVINLLTFWLQLSLY